MAHAYGVFAIIFISGIFAHAQSSKPSSIDDFLRIVEERAPEINLQKSEVSVSEKSIDQASQFLNPDVTIGAWRGKANNLNWEQTDVSFLQPIELGGKRSGRIQLAEAESKFARSNLGKTRGEVRAKALITLHRLRQLLYEKSLVEEAQIAFEKLIKSYKKRPQLSPEQSTSLFLFQMAKRDYDLKHNDSENELRNISLDIRRLSGLNVEDIMPLLPKKITQWPDVQELNIKSSPALEILRAKVEVSKSELELAKAESWPTPSIGPSYTHQNQFGEQAKVWGIVVTTKLPLLSTNQGGRAVSRENLALSEKQINLEETNLNLQKSILVENYHAKVRALKKSNVDEAIHKKHEQIESYFLRGLINSSLVIETHRQILDSQKNYHLSEISALEQYYQIRILDGTFFDGVIL